MNILYIGDIMASPGVKIVQELLSGLKKKYQIDLVIAQAENVTEGKGLSKADFQKLQTIGVDFCTGGNWTLKLDELHNYLGDPQQPVIRPANYPIGTPGRGWKYIETNKGKVLVISLLGSIVGRDAERPVDNPLKVVDQIIDQRDDDTVATMVNFHGDYSSEKRIIGYYLDGRVTAVVGDHWHVPTADSAVLPKGTAHISDVGMCGSLHSSLGVKFSSVIPRWRDGKVTPNEIELEGTMQFNSVLVKSNQDGLADSIEQIKIIV